MIDVNFDKMLSVLKESFYLLKQSSNVVFYYANNMFFVKSITPYFELFFSYEGIGNSVSRIISVNTEDLLRVFRVMKGNVSINITDKVVFSSSNNKYELACEFLDNLNVDKISLSNGNCLGKIENCKFKCIEKHVNTGIDDDSSNFCFVNGCWYATDSIANIVRVKSDLDANKIMIHGLYAKLLGNTKEDFEMYIAENGCIIFSNSNFKIRFPNNYSDGNIFENLSDKFLVDFHYLASVDAKEIYGSVSNLLSVMTKDKALDGIILSFEKGAIYIESDNKSGYEKIDLGNVSKDDNSPKTMNINPDTLLKVLTCCDNNIVDIYYCKEKELEGACIGIIKFEYDDVEQLFGVRYQI